jgi:hypothetical protein
LFGRRQREKRVTEEAAREAERRALFEELAKRPDTVCPFLGLAEARAEYHDGVTEDHRCYAFGDPAELSSEQQHKVCLQRGYGNCPRYLRGVLVIPTEELEALRRPRPPAPLAPRPAPAPAPAAAASGGRRGLAVALGALLLLVAGGGAAFLLLGNGGVANQSPSPSPIASLPATTSPSTEPSTPASTAPTGTPPPTATPDPTPAPEDVFEFYEVSVQPGVLYTLYEIEDSSGTAVNSREAEFENSSQAKVECLTRPDGTAHWRTLEGDYFGLSYIHEASGPFRIRAVYTTPEDTRSSEFVPNDEVCPS